MHDFLVMNSALTSHSPVSFTRLGSKGEGTDSVTFKNIHAESRHGTTRCAPRLSPDLVQHALEKHPEGHQWLKNKPTDPGP